jgi:putative tryptophan/tyrosine transport system substrate-binding protein
MKRRDFITLLGSAAATWPIAARAQQPRMPVIGFLGANAPATQSQWTDAFVRRLRELGWIEGRNIVIEYRWAQGRFERSPELAAELVRLKVDVIVTHANANVVAAKQATSVIPIVFAAMGDPLGDNLVASLARPGGNVTGLSNQAPELASKRVELLREVVPDLRRLGIMANAQSSIAMLEMSAAQAAAHTLGLEVATLEIRQAEEIASAFDTLKGRAEALYIVADPLVTFNRIRFSLLALGARLPTISSLRENVEAGGLMSYGPNLTDQFRRAADLVDKILRGAKPADIPIAQPTKFDLIINLTTAKVLGLMIPQAFMLRADEVIE